MYLSLWDWFPPLDIFQNETCQPSYFPGNRLGDSAQIPSDQEGPPPDPPPIRRDPRAVLRLMVQSGGGSLYQQEGEGGPVLDS